MKIHRAELFSKKKYQLAESPFYDARYDRISWVDITEGKLYIRESDSPVKTISFGQMIGAAVPLFEDDGYLVAATDGLYVYQNGIKKKIYDLTREYESCQRSNDAKYDPEGRLWFGSIVFEEDTPHHGNLYSYKDGTVLCRQSGTKLSNGMAWNRAADKFYFSDSDEKAVFVYDYDRETGSITGRKELFKVTGGVPDGMCIDKNDNLWVAVWGGSRLELRDGKSGEQLEEIDVPAVQVTSCCFYGSDDRLFITTAGEGLDGEHDGCLFECLLK